MKPMTEDHLAILRRHMVELIAIHVDLSSEELGRDRISDRVLQAMLRIPRHLFVPSPLAPVAYQDSPLPIGFGKTISQPFMAAIMTDLLAPERHHAVLEIGTGLGYQAAVLAELAGRVWSVEVVEEFAGAAEELLDQIGYRNVVIRVGDGARGWAEHAPYDKIMVTAAAELAPPPLLDQLKPGGRMVLPLGPDDAQHLTVMDKDAGGRVHTTQLIPVRFSKLETLL
jgi:protein-L-isoaspartate(D-aspartate) O-methyltransferase